MVLEKLTFLVPPKDGRFISKSCIIRAKLAVIPSDVAVLVCCLSFTATFLEQVVRAV